MISLLMAYTLEDCFQFYDFSNREQIEAIKDLLEQSSVLNKDVAHPTFPTRKTKDDLAQDILTLIKETQNKFTLRTEKTERWETKALPWMQQDKERTIRNLKKLNFVEKIMPQMKSADAICILGGAKKRMINRIQFAEFLIKNNFKAKNIILLAGERYVTEKVDDTKENLIITAKKFNLSDWTKLTETHLIKDIYETSTLSKENIPNYIIDTPARDLPRPTTETTLFELTEWLKDHKEIKSIIFISNQPHIKYQEAVISSVLKALKVDISFEVVGDSVADVSDTKSVTEGLGSYIWAATPAVLSKMGIKIHDELLRKEFETLYKNNPLIYKFLNQNFN